jgi:hypothetical protein
MAFSFAKLGFWKLIAGGIFLELAHVVLQFRWPELSSGWQGSRPLPVKIFGIAESCFLLAALMPPLEQVTTSTLNDRKARTPP